MITILNETLDLNDESLEGILRHQVESWQEPSMASVNVGSHFFRGFSLVRSVDGFEIIAERCTKVEDQPGPRLLQAEKFASVQKVTLNSQGMHVRIASAWVLPTTEGDRIHFQAQTLLAELGHAILEPVLGQSRADDWARSFLGRSAGAPENPGQRKLPSPPTADESDRPGAEGPQLQLLQAALDKIVAGPWPIEGPSSLSSSEFTTTSWSPVVKANAAMIVKELGLDPKIVTEQVLQEIAVKQIAMTRENATKEIAKLLAQDEIDQKIIVIKLEDPGATQSEIAKQVGISRQALNVRWRSLVKQHPNLPHNESRADKPPISQDKRGRKSRQVVDGGRAKKRLKRGAGQRHAAPRVQYGGRPRDELNTWAKKQIRQGRPAIEVEEEYWQKRRARGDKVDLMADQHDSFKKNVLRRKQPRKEAKRK